MARSVRNVETPSGSGRVADGAHATELKLPTVKRRFRQLAAEAVYEQQTRVAYLPALLQAEHQERRATREAAVD